jgi:hypothetical protein
VQILVLLFQKDTIVTPTLRAFLPARSGMSAWTERSHRVLLENLQRTLALIVAPSVAKAKWLPTQVKP